VSTIPIIRPVEDERWVYCAEQTSIGHEDYVGMSVCKVYISAIRWRIFTESDVALQKRRATAKSLNGLL
jgi:hypothetical protein